VNAARALPLSRLLAGIAPVTRDVAVSDLTLDSRQVRGGGAFLACRGARHHGLEFATEVARRGAQAILWEPDGSVRPPQLDSSIVLAEVPALSRRASEIADRFFASPSRALDVIGVTGTNGKTTCAWLLAQALGTCGRSAAYLGTLGSLHEGSLVAGAMTTPDAVTAQRELAGFRARGARAVAMEVSSHGLAQARVDAVHFDAAVFTNLTRDHLDFHGDMDRYGAAKASLFERADVRLRVFNTDDGFGARLAARPAFTGRIACSRAARPAAGEGPHVFAHGIEFGAHGTSFELQSTYGTVRIGTALLGEFNVDNVLAVLAVLLGSGITPPQAAVAARALAAPPGRLEAFAREGAATAVVEGCGWYAGGAARAPAARGRRGVRPPRAAPTLSSSPTTTRAARTAKPSSPTSAAGWAARPTKWYGTAGRRSATRCIPRARAMWCSWPARGTRSTSSAAARRTPSVTGRWCASCRRVAHEAHAARIRGAVRRALCRRGSCLDRRQQ
jgi:UDP-N-acetylmuramoyl-L-alanyl-D-glutamate--2,6-diaminopimelate ligase